MSKIPDELNSQPIAVEDQLSLASQIYEQLQNQIRGVDEKISALFAANALLAAALAFTQQVNLPDLPGQLEILLLVANVVMLFCTVGSGILALVGLYPRVPSSGKIGLFFFGDIAAQPVESFKRNFQSLSSSETLGQILGQIHILSGIAAAKNRWIRRASVLLIAALGLWFSILTLNLVFSALGRL